jgi:2-oxoglutarate ferredoxin oxidoreductase subunit gamma
VLPIEEHTVEFEILITGIGGQGIQLVAKSLALAAMNEGRSPLLTSEVSGAMRGGHSLATVVVGDGALKGLPVVSSAGAALELHPMNWDDVAQRLRPGAILVANSTLCPADTGDRDLRAYEVPATELSAQLGSSQPMGFILLGAFNALTGLVAPDSLVAAMAELLPPYRQQHIELNRQALELGAAQVPAGAAMVPLAQRVAS